MRALVLCWSPSDAEILISVFSFKGEGLILWNAESGFLTSSYTEGFFPNWLAFEIKKESFSFQTRLDASGHPCKINKGKVNFLSIITFNVLLFSSIKFKLSLRAGKYDYISQQMIMRKDHWKRILCHSIRMWSSFRQW